MAREREDEVQQVVICAPTAVAVAGAGKADKANADHKVTQMSPEDLKICKDNQVCRIHATGGTCKFEGSRRWKTHDGR